MMELGIAGKKALVCAASKGIGKAIAACLAREGTDLFLCARDKNGLEEAAREIEGESGKPVYFQAADLADGASRSKLVAEVMRVFSGIDILIHNVGGPKSSTVEETQLADWEKGFQQLFQSVAHLNQEFLPGMKERRWGRIVAVTSSSVLEPIPALAISNAMRSAVTSMLKTLADEVASFNVCINCVAPGQIYTGRTEERLKAESERGATNRETVMSDWTKAIPAGRMGTPEEFAAVVCFLCADRASYVTGSTISVDGGRRRSTY